MAVLCNQGPCIDTPITIGADNGVAETDPEVAYLLPSSSRQGSLDQNILLYIEPGSTPYFAAYFNQEPSSARVTVTGYLVDLSQ
jgi:hypothetical protein